MAIQPWSGVNQTWSEIQIKWSDVFLIQELLDEIISGGDAISAFQKLPTEKKRRFIELTVLVNGQDTYNSKKLVNTDIKLSAHHIKTTIIEIMKKVNIEINV